MREVWLREVDPSSLAAFRFVFGAALCTHIFYFHPPEFLQEHYVYPSFFFSFSLFEWLHLRPWSSAGMYYHFFVTGVAAYMVAVGLFFRFFSCIFFLGFFYLYLLEKAYDPNPIYLYLLLGFLFCFTRANHAWSADKIIQGKKMASVVPFWNILILRAQLFIVYFYAGIAKLINPDWISGAVLRQRFLVFKNDPSSLAAVLATEPAVYFFSYGAIFFDLSIGFLLVSRRTRWLGVGLMLFFHLFNWKTLGLQILPWIMIGSAVIFFEPDDPKKWWDGIKRFGRPIKDRKETPRLAGSNQANPVISHRCRLLFMFFAVYFLIQLLVPHRHWFYNSHVNWSKEGIRLSWHMMNNNFKTKIRVRYSTPVTADCRLRANPINGYQTVWMSAYPDMILQYAHYLRDELIACGVKSPEVYVYSLVSLNGRPYYPLVNPNVNLAYERYPFLSHAPWVMPHPDEQKKNPPVVWEERNDLSETYLDQSFIFTTNKHHKRIF